jgi:hypothetical protein
VSTASFDVLLHFFPMGAFPFTATLGSVGTHMPATTHVRHLCSLQDVNITEGLYCAWGVGGAGGCFTHEGFVVQNLQMPRQLGVAPLRLVAPVLTVSRMRTTTHSHLPLSFPLVVPPCTP